VNVLSNERRVIESGIPHSQAAAIVVKSLNKRRDKNDYFDVVPRKEGEYDQIL
jgi:hypothetical protein